MKKNKSYEQIFQALARAWPEAHCELNAQTPFQLLVAVMLSAQTTDVAVNKALAPFTSSHPQWGPETLVAMGVEAFQKVIASIGLAPTKAKNAVKTAEILIAEHGGEVPRNREALERLPGVGRKTANVVLNELRVEPTMAVDTHVARVSARLGLVPLGLTPLQIEERLIPMVPHEHRWSAHHHLIFQGRYVCKAKAPQCEGGGCALREICPRQGVL